MSEVLTAQLAHRLVGAPYSLWLKLIWVHCVFLESSFHPEEAIQKPCAQQPPPAPGVWVVGAQPCMGVAFAPLHQQVYWSHTRLLVSDSGRNVSGVTSNIICLPSFYIESSILPQIPFLVLKTKANFRCDFIHQLLNITF